MEQLHFITKLLDIKDPNIQILDIINKDTLKKSSKLDNAPSCPDCGHQMKKYDLKTNENSLPKRLVCLLNPPEKRRFKCYHCRNDGR